MPPLSGHSLGKGTLEHFTGLVRFDLASLFNEAFGLFLVLGFGLGFRCHLRRMSRSISQSLALDATDRKIGTLVSADCTGSIHKVGAHVQGAPACNGWTFWHFDAKGEPVSIDVLRQKLRAGLT